MRRGDKLPLVSPRRMTGSISRGEKTQIILLLQLSFPFQSSAESNLFKEEDFLLLTENSAAFNFCKKFFVTILVDQLCLSVLYKKDLQKLCLLLL